jgi:hypothetical protein
MAGDWIKVYRKLSRSDLWLSEPFTRGQAWMDLLMLAAYRPGFVRLRGVRVDYERGQYATAERFLCERWRWSRGKLRRFLDELETGQQIVQQKSNASTVVTIINYERYQDSSTADDTANRTADGPQTGPQTVQQTDQIQERKELKKEKKDKKGERPPKPPEPDLPPVLDSPEFRSVLDKWRAYKGRAYKPRGLQSLISQAAKRAEQFGLAAVVNAFETAMGNNHEGWNFASNFRDERNGRQRTIGPGQRFDSAAETRAPGKW